MTTISSAVVFCSGIKVTGLLQRNEAMEHSPETTTLQRSAGAKGNGPVNGADM
jgi:hypothetical protein